VTKAQYDDQVRLLKYRIRRAAWNLGYDDLMKEITVCQAKLDILKAKYEKEQEGEQ